MHYDVWGIWGTNCTFSTNDSQWNPSQEVPLEFATWLQAVFLPCNSIKVNSWKWNLLSFTLSDAWRYSLSKKILERQCFFKCPRRWDSSFLNTLYSLRWCWKLHLFCWDMLCTLRLLMECNEFPWDRYDIWWRLRRIVDYHVGKFIFLSSIEQSNQHRQDSVCYFAKILSIILNICYKFFPLAKLHELNFNHWDISSGYRWWHFFDNYENRMFQKQLFKFSCIEWLICKFIMKDMLSKII